MSDSEAPRSYGCGDDADPTERSRPHAAVCHTPHSVSRALHVAAYWLLDTVRRWLL